MKTYISGSISGRPLEEAESQFIYAEFYLENIKQVEFVNPMKLPHEHGGTWKEYMKEDIVSLMECDSIYMLKGWEDSAGARLEFQIAVGLGYEILFEN
jgi:hypothetical protein